MHPIVLQIGEITIYSWGMMLSLAILAGLWLAHKEARNLGYNPDQILDLTFVLVAGGLLGARLFYVFFYQPNYFLRHPWEIFMIWKAGLVYYGALIGGLVAGLGYMRWRRLAFWKTADLVTPALALGYGLVRIGCFMNGCCYGKVTTLPWGVVFPNLADHFTRHPTQLYLSIVGLTLSWVLYRLLFIKKFDGQVFLTYLVIYGILRTAVEGLRENLILFGSLTVSQVISFVLILCAMVLYYRFDKIQKN